MNWKDIIRKVAPTIGTALGGPLGGAAASTLSTVLLGKPDASEDELEQAIANATPEQFAAIKKAEYEFKTKMRELGIKEEDIAAHDRDSARQREIATGDKATPRTLASVAILGFFVVLGGVLWQGIPDGAGGNVTMILIGTLSTVVVQVFNYYFGSSSGSKMKDMMNGMKK